nr:P-loop NTPase [Oceanococcus sp. HetDA_MAG_MS8]
MPNEMIAVGGGKGGVGKSLFSLALAMAYAERGQEVVLVDLDLGAGNLHTYLGIAPTQPSIAEFLERKAASLDELRLHTSVPQLSLISGAGFLPGMANPPHWLKLKLIRHLQQLPCAVVILDLGAGVSFNTLDFFLAAQHGVVVSVPEAPAIMNAYSFLKAVAFRQLHRVFKQHQEVAPLLASHATADNAAAANHTTLEMLFADILRCGPDAAQLGEEVLQSLQAGLVMNRLAPGNQHELLHNLLKLAQHKLGLPLTHLGNMPEVREMGHYLLKVPSLTGTPSGRAWVDAAAHIADSLVPPRPAIPLDALKRSYSDTEVAAVIELIEQLDDSIFPDGKRDSWKLRMYFKPETVLHHLLDHGLPPQQLNSVLEQPLPLSHVAA